MNEPTPSEWVQQALFGLDELSAAYHEGGADGHGLTVKEFREHRDSIRAQLLNAAAAVAVVPAHTPGALDVERLARAMESTTPQPPDVHHMAVDWRTTAEKARDIAAAYEAASPSEETR